MSKNYSHFGVVKHRLREVTCLILEDKPNQLQTGDLVFFSTRLIFLGHKSPVTKSVLDMLNCVIASVMQESVTSSTVNGHAIVY